MRPLFDILRRILPANRLPFQLTLWDDSDSETSIRKTLGAPLSESEVEPYTTWLYSSAPTSEFEADGRFGAGIFPFQPGR